jgi:Xaa-Pro dipeptidase
MKSILKPFGKDILKLAPIHFVMRIKEVVARLDSSFDYGVVLKKENIFYLTGFFPTAFAVLVLKDEPYLAVSELDETLASVAPIEVKVIKSFIKELKFKGKVGIEKRHTTVSFVEEFLKGCRFEDLKFIDVMRQIKDNVEVDLIKKAIKITEDALRNIEPEGFTEKEVAAKIVYEINKAAGVAFDPIVASGKNSAVPHHTSSDKKINATDPVIIDLGANFEHYNCDMSRTFSHTHTEKFKEVYQAVIEAQKEGIRHLTTGTPVRECDMAVRRVLKEYGFEDYFIHSSGHGVGLDVHESPKISKDSEDVFKEGMVMTVEPGVYIPGWGGVRIEDVILVGEKPKVLTGFPKMGIV